MFIDSRSITIVLWLERARPGDPKIFGLDRSQACQFDAELIEMQLGDLLIEMLGENIDLVFIAAMIRPQLDLRQHLVGEGRTHHEARMSGGAA